VSKIKNKNKITLIILILLFIIAISTSIMFGTVHISFKKLIAILFALDTNEVPKAYKTIILDLRLPRTFLAGLIGAGLSVIGVVYQSIFKNPMADPYVLGISSGAALGATVGIAIITKFSHNFALISILSFFGALFTLVLVYKIAVIKNILPVITLLLAGISMNFLFSSMISFIMIVKKEHMSEILFWIMGNINSASWKDVLFILPIIFFGILIIYYFSNDLNIMQTGEETAKTLGVEVEKVKKILLIITSIMVAGIVSISGIIGFVGLIVPHMVRLIIGPNNKILIPFSAFLGAIVMIFSDVLARVIISPSEIPLGIITSLIGSPYFIYLLYKNKKKMI